MRLYISYWLIQVILISLANEVNYNWEILIVSFLLDPTSWIFPHNQFSDFIENENEDREWKCWKPPINLQRIHLQHLIHAWCVGKKGSQTSFEDEAKVHYVIAHSLLEHRVLPGFTDDEVRPLHNNNGNKESSMTSILQNFSVLVSPLLAIGIFQVINGWWVPVTPQTK